MERIYKGIFPPENTNIIWLDISNKIPVLKKFNGDWEVINDFSESEDEKKIYEEISRVESKEDNKPSKLEAVGNGSYLYRYNIKETERPTIEGDETLTQWECDEVTVWSPVTANKITQAVIAERWPKDYEQKLVNEYNSVKFNILTGDMAIKVEEAYKNFLTERNDTKTMIDEDCKELDIK